MAIYERSGSSKIINLKSRRFRKKHQKLFNLIYRLLSIFHKGPRHNLKNKYGYKSTVNH